MKKMATLALTAALTCSIVPVSALAVGRMSPGAQPSVSQQSITAGLGLNSQTPQARVSTLGGQSANQAADKTVNQNAGNLEIKEAGTYVLTGRMRGTVRVDPGAGDVRLVMDNAMIDGNGGPAITAVSGDSLTITMPEGSNSQIVSTGGLPGCVGTIQGSVPLFFEGNGSLEVVGGQQPGIVARNADMTFNGGDFRVVSEGVGIMTRGTEPGAMTFNGGDFAFGVGERNFQAGGVLRDNGGTFGTFEPGNDYAERATQAMWEGAAPMGSYQGGMQQIQQPGMAQQQGMQQPGNGQQQNGNMQQPDMQQPGTQQTQQGGMPQQQGNGQQQPGMPADNQFGGPQQTVTGSTSTAGEIVTSTAENTASTLSPDYANATTIYLSDDASQVKISEAGTYIVTGSASDGNIVVKKETTGVVLVLSDLDLTSTTGATLSVNKNAEVQIVVQGTVTLTDNENPADEDSADEAVADAYDGAAIKVKAGSQVYLTGDGTLNVNGNAKNGIKAGDDASLVIDGTTLNITAANDGINANYDVTILSGDVTITAVDDAIHADHILTIGDEQTGTGPTVDIKESTEGLEGTVVNIFGGDVSVVSSDDAVNAANKDGAYEGELGYSVNMTGGNVTITSTGDGIDSNGNVNLVGGSANISSSSMGGEAGIDYDGDLYVSDEFQLNNRSGVSGPDAMPGQMGGMDQSGQMDQPGQMGGMDQPGQMGQPGRR